MNAWIIIILFWVFHALDFYKTKKGILSDASNEGNPLTAYLHRKASKWAFNIAHLLYVILITLVVLFGGSVGLWIGYSAITYNFLGYLSWTKLNRWKQKTNRVEWTPILIAVSVFLGYLLSLLNS